ncbi:MAG: methyltransferase [Woeseiaceae bacterium]
MEILKSPQGEFRLSRYPKRKKELLRAWDAADEYLLSYIDSEIENKEELSFLIINDACSALATSLSQCSLTLWSDSYLSYKAFQENFKDNNIDTEGITFYKSTETPATKADVILIKIPKNLSFLEDTLIRLQPLLTADTKIIASGMVKSIHTSTLKLFEKYIGSTTTSLAKKKARLIFVQFNPELRVNKTPYPKVYPLENSDFEISNHANIFSREKLDIGTRFFLQHLPQNEKFKTVVDLGCGNGVVGLLAAQMNRQAEILFYDESFMAIQSAKENMQKNLPDNRNAQYFENDCLTGVEDSSIDLILNNPPFHQNTAVGDEVAWQMFQQSKKALKQAGELWVVGNRHLSYHIKLKKIFGNCISVASNKKFVILKAVKH